MKYSEEAIGKTAGAIWNILNDKGEISFSNLHKESGLTRDEFLLGLGWLFREGQLKTHEVKSSVIFNLK